MTSLAQRDTSLTLIARSGETEDLRTRGAKRFLVATLPDGRKQYRVGASVGPIHYQADPFAGGEWHEIDMDVVLTPDKAWDAACESNGYQVRFWQSVVRDSQTYRYVAEFRRAGRYLRMAPIALAWENTAGARQVISAVKAVGMPTINNDEGYVRWNNAFGTGLHFQYNLTPDKFFKSLVIDSKASLPTPIIGASGLKLSLVLALEWDLNATARNGFASGVTTTLGAGDLASPDENLADPEVFDFHESRGSLWWLQKPMAWDSATDRHDVPVAWRLVRKGGACYGVFSVTATALNNAAVVYPVFVDTAITEELVGASADDGQEKTAGGTPSYTDINIYANNTTAYTCAMRFTTVPIPAGATIDSSSISLAAYSTSYDDPDIRIYCEAADSSAALTTDVNNITGRALTAGYGTWTATGIGTSYVASSDISVPVQAVISRTGWATGNSLSVLTKKISGTAFQFKSWDYGGHTSGPKFNATYTEGAPAASFNPAWAINSNQAVN